MTIKRAPTNQPTYTFEASILHILQLEKILFALFANFVLHLVCRIWLSFVLTSYQGRRRQS